MLYVINAGGAVKWFIPEEDSAIAHRLLTRYLQGLDTAIAPDLLTSECGNVFWRRCRQGDITAAEATESIADLLTLDIPLVLASRNTTNYCDVPYSMDCGMALTYTHTEERTHAKKHGDA